MIRTLHLHEYDSQWPARFAEESARFREAIGGQVVAIEHIGSTSVPGLVGKPILDVAVAVESEEAAARRSLA